MITVEEAPLPRGLVQFPPVADLPSSIRIAHRRLLDDLEATVDEVGLVGVVARSTANALRSHILNEEGEVLPLLAYLSALPAGRLIPEIEEIQIMTFRMEAALPRMLEDHRLILSSLRSISETAGGSGGARLAGFADRFALHVLAEEEVHFPAAMLVGEALSGRAREYQRLRRYYRGLEGDRRGKA